MGSAAIVALPGLRVLSRKQTLDPALGKALLPSPHRRPADADALRYLLRRVPIRRGERDARPLRMFDRPATVGHDRRQLLAPRGAQNRSTTPKGDLAYCFTAGDLRVGDLRDMPALKPGDGEFVLARRA